MKRFLLGCIAIYRGLISPLLPDLLPVLPDMLGVQPGGYRPLRCRHGFTFEYWAHCALPSLVQGRLRPGALIVGRQQ